MQKIGRRLLGKLVKRKEMWAWRGTTSDAKKRGNWRFLGYWIGGNAVGAWKWGLEKWICQSVDGAWMQIQVQCRALSPFTAYTKLLTCLDRGPNTHVEPLRGPQCQAFVKFPPSTYPKKVCRTRPIRHLLSFRQLAPSGCPAFSLVVGPSLDQVVCSPGHTPKSVRWVSLESVVSFLDYSLWSWTTLETQFGLSKTIFNRSSIWSNNSAPFWNVKDDFSTNCSNFFFNPHFAGPSGTVNEDITRSILIFGLTLIQYAYCKYLTVRLQFWIKTYIWIKIISIYMSPCQCYQ